MGKKTTYMGDVKCWCGRYGKLRMLIRKSSCYYEIEHYRRSGVGWSDHNSPKEQTHYIGDSLQLGGRA